MMLSISEKASPLSQPVVLHGSRMSEWCSHAFSANMLRGRVESVFPRALNWSDHAGQLFCLLDESLGNIPFGTTVELEPGYSFLDSGLRIGDPVCCDAKTIRLGPHKLLVDLRDGKITAQEPLRPCEHPALLRENVQYARSLLMSESTSKSGLAGLLHDPATHARNACNDPFIHAAGRALQMLIHCFAHNDAASAVEWGNRLVGLGPGLTPSGDDALVGLLAAWSASVDMSGRHAFYDAFVQGLAEALPGRTTLVAAAFLGHALAGRFSDSVVAYVNSLHSDRGAIDHATRQLSAFGASSGVDTASGALAGFASALNQQGEFYTPQILSGD